VSKIRIGIVGMGQRSCLHGGAVFRGCKEEMQIAAICETRPERLARGKEMYEGEFGYEIPTYEDYLAMYEQADLDAVYVASPNDMHRDMTIAAFEKGLHVLCEKPMEVSLAKCDEMINAAARHNRVLVMAMQMHYRVRYHKVRELIESGAIGRVANVWCTEYRGPFIESKDWVWDQKKSGGAIVEKNCHHYDILDLWVQSDPTTVYASGNILKHTNRSGMSSEIVDNAWIVNDYENGARGMVGINFLAEKKHCREFGVIGTEGRVMFSSADAEVLHVEYNDRRCEEYDYKWVPEIRGGVFLDFVRCIRTGEQPLVTGERARKSLLVPLAAERSIQEKRVVNVSEL